MSVAPSRGSSSLTAIFQMAVFLVCHGGPSQLIAIDIAVAATLLAAPVLLTRGLLMLSLTRRPT
jgi:hypothetical protein